MTLLMILAVAVTLIAVGVSCHPWKTLGVSSAVAIATLSVGLVWAEIVPGESPAPFYFCTLSATVASILHSRSTRRH